MSTSNLETSWFYIKGLHCASCQLIIEKTLIKIPEIDAVDVNLKTARLMVRHQSGYQITPKELNQIFKDNHYTFSSHSSKSTSSSPKIDCDDACSVVPDSNPVNPWKTAFIALGLIVGFLMLNQSGFSSLITVNATSSLPAFFLFGLLAGFSTCAALTGGIVLSLSKQWLSLYSQNDSFSQKAQPHLLFNTGRVVSYTLIGALLGLIGNFFRLSPLTTATMIIAVSVLMVLLALQMLGVKALQGFRFALPKSITGKFADESNFQGKFGPLLMGALTFFLPCGFTFTAQALALASGNPLQGALIMGLFALGTVPGLLAIGLSSVKFNSNPQSSKQFSMIAGILVLFFAAFNINSQLAVLGVSNINDLVLSSSSTQPSQSTTELPPVVNGKQVVKIDASASGYTPNRIRMRANTPTRWEINDTGTSGCTNAIISRGLFEGQIALTPGTVSTKEFTSPKPGVYKFSCWMGMVSGVVEVVDSSGSTGAAANTAPVESGAKGCGCGGGSAGGTCGGAR